MSLGLGGSNPPSLPNSNPSREAQTHTSASPGTSPPKFHEKTAGEQKQIEMLGGRGKNAKFAPHGTSPPFSTAPPFPDPPAPLHLLETAPETPPEHQGLGTGFLPLQNSKQVWSLGNSNPSSPPLPTFSAVVTVCLSFEIFFCVLSRPTCNSTLTQVSGLLASATRGTLREARKSVTEKQPIDEAKKHACCRLTETGRTELKPWARCIHQILASNQHQCGQRRIDKPAETRESHCECAAAPHRDGGYHGVGVNLRHQDHLQDLSKQVAIVMNGSTSHRPHPHNNKDESSPSHEGSDQALTEQHNCARASKHAAKTRATEESNEPPTAHLPRVQLSRKRLRLWVEFRDGHLTNKITTHDTSESSDAKTARQQEHNMLRATRVM